MPLFGGLAGLVTATLLWWWMVVRRAQYALRRGLLAGAITGPSGTGTDLIRADNDSDWRSCLSVDRVGATSKADQDGDALGERRISTMKPSARWGLLGIACVLGAWITYHVGRGDWSDLAQRGSERPRGWTRVEDAAGFSVELPGNWKVQVDRSSGRILIAGNQGEQVVIWPVFIFEPLDTRAAPAMLRHLAVKFWPDVRWQSPQSVGPTAVRMQGQQQDRVATVLLTWITSAKGTAAYVYGLAASQSVYHQSEETFATLLKSFRLVGTPTEEPRSLRYVTWQDPRENAFSVEIPQGWKASGGLFRFASVDIRPALEVISPDGKIRITGGDAEIPAFAVPNQMLEWTGFREGSWYSPGYGVTLMVRRYVAGMDFAREYVLTKATRGCVEARITEARDRPEAVQAINALARQYDVPGFSTQWTAGEVAFTCRREGRPLHGYYFAATKVSQAYQTAVWNVELLYGYLSASDKVAEAQAALEHLLATFQLNPQWVRMQQNLTAATSQIVTRTHQEISNIISSAYWTRQSVQDELGRRRSNAILGVEDVIDPLTGRELKVESGSSYYWVDHRERIVGTETDVRPSLDFRQLIRLP